MVGETNTATREELEKTARKETLAKDMDPFKQSIGSNLLLLMQQNSKQTKAARRFNFKVDFEEIDRIMEEEDESAPIVMPV